MTRAGGKRPLAVAIAAGVLVVAGCSGGSDESTSTVATSSTAATTGTTTATTPPSGGEAGEVALYFTGGEQFHKVSRPLRAGGSQPRRALAALLDGPTRAERRGEPDAETVIPDGVSIAAFELGGGGTADVALSARFLAGIPVAPSERSRDEESVLDARLAQVTYTLTQFADLDAVRLTAGGEPVRPATDRRDYAAPDRGPLLFSAPREAKPAAKSPGTREIQERLAKLRFLPRGAVDGVPGYRTQQAVIAFQAWNGLDRDGVVGPQTTAALADAHRPRPQAGGPSHRVEVYRDRGVALLIERDRVKRAIHVSSGGPATPTPAGRFEIFRKELRSWSVPFQVWLPYASYFNQGIAFHEYPDVPPYPASHGCVRVPAPEAKGVYRFASLGTVVFVF